MKTNTTTHSLSPRTSPLAWSAILKPATWLLALLVAPALSGCVVGAGDAEETVGEAEEALVVESCNGVDDDLDFLIDEGDVCQFGARQRYENHEYLLGGVDLSWDTALAACRGRGFDLVKINDAGENAWLAQFTAADQLTRWTGLSNTDPNGSYHWTDGTEVDYANWAPWKIPMPGVGYGFINAGGVWWLSSGNTQSRMFCELFNPVTWTSAVNVTVTGTWLQKSAGSGWSAGATSDVALTSGDGFVQFTTGETDKSKIAGLGNGNANPSYTDIEFGILLRNNGHFEVWEAVNGSSGSKGDFGSFAANDVFRVEVLNGQVRYVRNGAVFYTSATAPTYPLVLDTSIEHVGGTLGDARLRSCDGDLEGCIEPGMWSNVRYVMPQGNNLVRTTGIGSWAGGASTYASIDSGDGYVEFTTSETGTDKIAGLGKGDANQSYTDIEYGILLRHDQVEVWESVNGSSGSKGTFGTFTVDDVFRVEVLNNQVRYLQNGVPFYTSLTAPTYPLVLDTSFEDVGATITNATIVSCEAGDTDCIDPGLWSNVRYVRADGDDLVRTTGTNGWAGGASSSASIASGNGHVVFTTSETGTDKIVGLGNGDVNQSYTDVEFGILLRHDQVEVWEAVNGASSWKGTFGSFVVTDEFKVEVFNNQVRYLKNGAVFYTSLKVPSYPLVIDTSFEDVGATINATLVDL